MTTAEPPAWVELPWATTSVLYRLVRRPRSDRPARDHLGYYLYVPLTRDLPQPAEASGAQVIPLNGSYGSGPRTRVAAEQHFPSTASLLTTPLQPGPSPEQLR